MTKPVLSSCFGLECLDFEESLYNQLPGNPKPYLTVYDILLVSLAITLNHKRTFLLHMNALAYVKAEI